MQHQNADREKRLKLVKVNGNRVFKYPDRFEKVLRKEFEQIKT